MLMDPTNYLGNRGLCCEVPRVPAGPILIKGHQSGIVFSEIDLCVYVFKIIKAYMSNVILDYFRTSSL